MTLRLFALLAAALLAAPLAAQVYPSQAVKLVNPYAAGGPVDLVAREVAKGLTDVLGQPVVIENKPGGGATIGAEFVARAKPDGYTLLASGSPSLIITPAIQAKPAYDGLRDFTPVCTFATVPYMIVANPALPVASVRELIEYARSRPGKLTFGTPGSGSIGHLAGELFNRMAGVSLVHVPYKGGAPAVTDTLGGQIDLAIVNSSAVLPQVRAGKLRALGIATARRSEAAPDIPTVEESGLPGWRAETWYGLFGPANLPGSIVNVLYQATAKVMASPALKARLQQTQGADVTMQGPGELAARLREEQAQLVPVIKSLGLKID